MAEPGDHDDGGAVAARGSAVEVTPRHDGPLVVTGPIILTAADGTTEEHTGRTFLCRCGGSAIKPLCDGTHKRIDFEAPGVIPARKPEA